MPNKDSFTFSDKLKKSKSLPLSKRIPSKVGGDGKAKRTLIQRAQRDLPFIIVAAAALLLLPILSRNSGTDDLGVETPMDFVSPDTSLSDSGGLGQEIAPSSGFKNPLDYIVSRSGKDTDPNRDTIDADEEEPGYEPTTPPYTSETGGEPNATTKYAPAAKGAIRNALVRKATQISALRNSKTMAAGASTGVSRSLATGSAASSGGASGPRVGVRPVALQPMASAGKGGRSETGEGLYAEAARSLGAMNRSGSKQALFDAQLKNVDGTPLGSIGGGPNFGAGAGKLGAGGAPSNNVGYKPYLPWWWDFEKQKAMKMWELWNYNFQKALSDNIIKVGTGLALCLTTGNADGKVDKFLGDPGGADDYTCPGGNVQDWETHRDLMGKDESGSGESKESRSKGDFDAWVKLCNESNGNKGYQKTSSSKKNMLDVRLRCLGFKYKNSGLYKWLKGAEYSVDCSGVDSDPMSFKFTASRERHLGHYVLAKNLNNEQAGERIIYVGAGGNLDNKALQAVLTTLNTDEKAKAKYVVTMIKGFKANGARMSNDNVSKAESKLQKLKSYQAVDIARKYSSDDDGTAEEKYNADVSAAEAKLAQATKEAGNDGGDASNLSYESRFTMFQNAVASSIKSGKYIYDSYGEDKFKVLKDCPVASKFLETKIDNTGLVSGNVTIDKKSAGFITCVPNADATTLNPGADYTFRANITNPGKNVFAVFVENVQYAAAGEKPSDRFVVKKVVNLSASEFKNYKGEDGTFYIDSKIGLAASTKEETLAAAAPGTGRVYWITTNGSSEPLVDTNVADETKPSYFNSVSISASQLVDVYGGSRMAVCEYRWGCDAKLCPSSNKKLEGVYCAKEETDATGNTVYRLFLAANNIAGANKLVRVSESPIVGKEALDILKARAASSGSKNLKAWADSKNEEESSCEDCGAKAFALDGFACQDICYMEASRKVFESKGQDSTGKEVGSIEDIKKLYPDVKENSPLCPTCNPIVTQAPTPEKCTVTISGEFAPASYTLNDKLMTDIKAQAKKFYGDCVKNLNSESKVDIYVQGFTSYSGEVKDLNAKNVCAIGDTECESNQAKNLGARNILLSEDRAVSVGAEFIKQLKVNMAADKGLDRKVSMSALFFESKDAKRDAPSDTFNIKPRTGNQITDLINSSFYTIAENATLYGQDPTVTSNSKAPLTLVFNVYGYGAMGASEKEKASDRFVRVSTERSFARIKN